MPRDIHNTMKYSRAFPPVAATTDNTVYVSTILDTALFDANEFVLLCGTETDVDVTFTALFEEGNDPALADNAAIASTALLGTLNGTVTGGVSAGFQPGFADDNTCRKIGYKGTKRYLRMTITPANNTGNVFFAGVWIQGAARAVPQAAQGV